MLGAMETGYQRGRIQDESMLYEHRKHDGSLPIIGVNTFLDMCRTSLNVTGDLATAVVVAHRSGEKDLDDAAMEKLDEIVR